MDKLPREVVLLINSYLDVPTRLSYVRVCKYVHSVISQVLCQHLTIDSPAKFDKVFIAFKRQKEKRHQISSVQLSDCELDVFTVLSLPDIFPNLKRLVLDSNIAISRLYDHTYLRQLGKLKNLERLDVTIKNGLDFILCILRGIPLPNLTHLRIKWSEEVDHDIETLTTLIRNIHYFPSLTSLELESFQIGLDDLEQLDKGAKNLTKLVFKKIKFFNNPSIRIITRGETTILTDKNGEECTIRPNTTLRSFHLSKIKLLSTPASGALKKELDKWIQYITLKYPALDSLGLEVTHLDGSRVFPVHTFETRILSLLTSMTNLTHYAVQLEPLSDSVTQIIEQNKCIKLKSLDVRVDGRAIEIQFANMTKSCFTDTVENMRIKDIAIQHRPDFHYTEYMIYHITQFNHLTKLELDTTDMCGHDYGLLINIIQKIPNLNTLSIRKFTCDPITYPTFNMNVITTSNIKNLRLGVTVRRKGTRSVINDIFRFCIQSCPRLIDFEIVGKLHCNWGNINLDFRNALHIQSLKLNIKGFVFYTFNTLSFGSTELEPFSRYKVPLDHFIPDLDPSLPTPPNLKGMFFINILSDKYIHFDLAEPEIKF